MIKRSLGLAAVVITIGACGAAPTKDSAGDNADPRECAQNFEVAGSFLSGKTFKTSAVVSGVNQKDAMKRAAQFISSDGWTLNNVNESLGIISASQTVSYGEGKTAPLNIAINESSGGVEVGLTYSTSGGVSSPANAVKEHFCKTVGAVAGQ